MVELTQYNSNSLAAGTNSPQFTRMEDMGWNLKGQPWLIHSFKTYATDADGDYAPASQDYGMNVPHLLYKNVNTETGANDVTGVDAALLKQGQFISGRSWTDGTTLEMGSAFFTQTAIMDDVEELTFKQPEYIGTEYHHFLARVSIFRNTDDTFNGVYDDVVEICPDQDAEAEISYNPGSDALKLYALNESLAHIYVAAANTKLSLVSKAPVEVEIPLGITIPENGDYTISLPEPQAYSDYEAVWLIDHKAGTSTNLLEQNYVLSNTVAGDVDTRLALKFGGGKPDSGVKVFEPKTIKLMARYGKLPLGKLPQNTRVRIHNASGMMIYNGITDELDRLTFPDGVYIVKIY